MSVTDYRNRLRVAVARDFVVDSRLDMERVAERAGFASTRQLRRVWRKFYPAPPSKTLTRSYQPTDAEVEGP